MAWARSYSAELITDVADEARADDEPAAARRRAALPSSDNESAPRPTTPGAGRLDRNRARGLGRQRQPATWRTGCYGDLGDESSKRQGPSGIAGTHPVLPEMGLSADVVSPLPSGLRLS